MNLDKADIILAGVGILSACAVGAWQIWPIVSEDRKKRTVFYSILSVIVMVTLVVMTFSFLGNEPQDNDLDSSMVKVGVHGVYLKKPLGWMVDNREKKDFAKTPFQGARFFDMSVADLVLSYKGRGGENSPSVAMRSISISTIESRKVWVENTMKSLNKIKIDDDKSPYNTYKWNTLYFSGAGRKLYYKSVYIHMMFLGIFDKEVLKSAIMIVGICDNKKENEKIIDVSIEKIASGLRFREPTD